MIEAGVCRKLVELLVRPSPSVQTPALRTVGNIVTGNEPQTQTIIDAGVFPNLLELLGHSKKGIRKEACWAISNITAGNKDQIQSTIDANVIPPLVKLLKSAEFDIKKEAAWAIANATSGGTPRQIKFLVSEDCIPPLCELLSAADEKLVTTALEALGNILQVGSADAGDLSANKMAILIVKSEGPTRIRQVGSARAKAMLESYFQDWESWDLSPVSVSPDDFDGAAERGHRAEEKAADDAVDAVAIEFPLHAAAKAGQVDALARLLDEGADVDQTKGDGETPLWIACDKGDTDAARLLLDRGADVDKAAEGATTALFAALDVGHAGTARLLLERGAKVELANGYTNFLVACVFGDIEAVRLDLDGGADVNQAQGTGETSLLLACAYGHVDLARLLLDKGAEVNGADEDGETPLAIAKEEGHSAVVALLKKHRRASAAARGKERGPAKADPGGQVRAVYGPMAAWYHVPARNSLRKQHGEFPPTPEALAAWTSFGAVTTAFLDDQGVAPTAAAPAPAPARRSGWFF